MKRMLSMLLAGCLFCLTLPLFSVTVQAEETTEAASAPAYHYKGYVKATFFMQEMYFVGQEIDPDDFTLYVTWTMPDSFKVSSGITYKKYCSDVINLDEFPEYGKLDMSEVNMSVPGTYNIYFYPLHDTIVEVDSVYHCYPSPKFRIYLEDHPQTFTITVVDPASTTTTATTTTEEGPPETTTTLDPNATTATTTTTTTTYTGTTTTSPWWNVGLDIFANPVLDEYGYLLDADGNLFVLDGSTFMMYGIETTTYCSTETMPATTAATTVTSVNEGAAVTSTTTTPDATTTTTTVTTTTATKAASGEDASPETGSNAWLGYLSVMGAAMLAGFGAWKLRTDETE